MCSLRSLKHGVFHSFANENYFQVYYSLIYIQLLTVPHRGIIIEDCLYYPASEKLCLGEKLNVYRLPDRNLFLRGAHQRKPCSL